MYNNANATAYLIGYIFGGLITCIILGLITKYISKSKGYKGGFAWGFFLNIIGIIVVACKPDNRQFWLCPSCGGNNANDYKYCMFCGTARYSVQNEVMPKQEESAQNNVNIALIKQLAELHSQGILSDEEFEAKKAELLKKM